jgi:hypothetical protein
VDDANRTFSPSNRAFVPRLVYARRSTDRFDCSGYSLHAHAVCGPDRKNGRFFQVDHFYILMWRCNNDILWTEWAGAAGFHTILFPPQAYGRTRNGVKGRPLL